eukprot:2458420-Rhodomonas_salina.1
MVNDEVIVLLSQLPERLPLVSPNPSSQYQAAHTTRASSHPKHNTLALGTVHRITPHTNTLALGIA